jgi:branched-chain amino acid transport system substrate-binding protein
MLAAFLLRPVATRWASAQSKTHAVVPYDSIAIDGENYAGPARESRWDEAGPIIYIGLLAPLHGPEKADGEALVAAAQMALQDSTQRPTHSGRRIKLAIGDESGPAWGHVSDAILHLVLQQDVVALITSTDGADTHVSEQVCNRIGVPILTLSNDATTTQIDIPWIFRLGPSDTSQAQIIASNVYRERGMKKLLVISEGDHDGRGGIAAMQQAASSMGEPFPEELVLDPLHPDFPSVITRIQTTPPQAIVLWTQADVAQRLLPLLQASGIPIPVYLSQQAAQSASGLSSSPTYKVENAANSTAARTIATRGTVTAARESFARRYLDRTGRPPSAAAAEAYDAVCLTVRALRAAGPNRARVRYQLAKVQDFPGVSGTITFDRQGNNPSPVHLVALRQPKPSTGTGDRAE